MNQKPLPGIPEQILQSADQMMEQIQSGKIRNIYLAVLLMSTITP